MALTGVMMKKQSDSLHMTVVMTIKTDRCIKDKKTFHSGQINNLVHSQKQGRHW